MTRFGIATKPALLAIVFVLIAACSSAAPTPSPTPLVTPLTPTASPSPSVAPTASPSPSLAPTASLPPSGPPATATPIETPGLTPSLPPTPGPVVTGPASLTAPDTLAADTPFDVNWTGPNNQGDYITIVPVGTAEWSGQPYFYTTAGTPGHMTSPTTPGEYELWYVDGVSSTVAVRRPMTVTAFVGSLTGPPTVEAGTAFSVSWSGPNAQGDYVTIQPVGSTGWNGESFFYTYVGNPQTLYAPLAAGPHELWYVALDETVMFRVPITVSPSLAKVTVPPSATHGTTFQVTWTGPNAPNDYVTIVLVGSPEGSYLSYAYSAAGSPATLTAPDTAGAYEVRYVYGSDGTTLTSAPIEIN